MEEKKDQLFILYQVLSQKFDQQQWKFISCQSPQYFLKTQELILNKLLVQKYFFEKYFQNFYSNHVKLLNWSILAGWNKATVSPYVFKNLINKGRQYFHQRIKQDNKARTKRKKKQQKQQIDINQIKSMQSQVYQNFFNNLLISNIYDTPEKLLDLKLKQSIANKKSQNLDGHDFYIKTFNACNGWKYIFYNYEKHMRGLNEKSKYNQKIRNNQQKCFQYSKQRNKLGLLNYQHQNLNKIQVKVHKLNQVIKNSKTNSLKGFKNLVNKSYSNKLVFQNHQGQPVTYRLSRL